MPVSLQMSIPPATNQSIHPSIHPFIFWIIHSTIHYLPIHLIMGHIMHLFNSTFNLILQWVIQLPTHRFDKSNHQQNVPTTIMNHPSSIHPSQPLPNSVFVSGSFFLYPSRPLSLLTSFSLDNLPFIHPLLMDEG